MRGNQTCARSAEKVAVGMAHRGQLRIVIGLDEDTFAEVRARALADGVSFAKAARELIEWGLIAADEGAQ